MAGAAASASLHEADLFAVVVFVAGWAAVGGQQRAASRRPRPAPRRGASPGISSHRIASTCHNERLKTGGLSLERCLDRIVADAETWEKVVRKVRAGLMPPAGARRPERAALDAFRRGIETAIDRAAAANPNPGRAPLHRMNRAEYANAIRDLLALDVDSVDAASRRRFEPRLRQHRRRAGRVAVAARALRGGGREDQPARRRRTRRRAGPGHLHRPGRSEPEPDARGPAARHARRHHRHAQLPGRRRVPDPAVAAEAQFRPGVRRRGRGRRARGDAERRAREAVQARRSADVLHARDAGLASGEAAADRSARGAGEDDARHPARAPAEGEGRSADDRRGVPAEEPRRERGPRPPAGVEHLRRLHRHAGRLHHRAASLARGDHRAVQRRPASARRPAAGGCSPAARASPAEEDARARRQIVSTLARRAYRRARDRRRRRVRCSRFYQRGARQDRQLRRRDRDGAAPDPGRSRSSSSASSRRRRPSRPGRRIASATPSWPRGCRSSCGRRFPTTSC